MMIREHGTGRDRELQPGEIVEFRDGARFKMLPSGSLVNVDKPAVKLSKKQRVKLRRQQGKVA
jgi:hypothetical protein